MEVRRPYVAGAFYPGQASACTRQLEACLAEQPPEMPADTRVVGVAVPHAGWTFSGPTAGLAFSAIRRDRIPGTFVVLSASHSPFVREPTLMRAGAWETPLGRIDINADLAGRILGSGLAHFVDDAAAHETEHALEVQVPFIQHLFEGARIVPIIVPPARTSHLVGEAVAKTIQDADEDAVVVGSADLTHYGPRFGLVGHGSGEEANAWVKDVNDRRIVDLLLALKADAIVAEASQRHNSCGSGALAALVAAAVTLGADEARLLRQTTSYEVQPDPYGDTIVGYASVAFLAPKAAA
jgi:AmmeMemoRadiSam system protein B